MHDAAGVTSTCSQMFVPEEEPPPQRLTCCVWMGLFWALHMHRLTQCVALVVRLLQRFQGSSAVASLLPAFARLSDLPLRGLARPDPLWRSGWFPVGAAIM